MYKPDELKRIDTDCLKLLLASGIKKDTYKQVMKEYMRRKLNKRPWLGGTGVSVLKLINSLLQSLKHDDKTYFFYYLSIHSVMKVDLHPRLYTICT